MCSIHFWRRVVTCLCVSALGNASFNYRLSQLTCLGFLKSIQCSSGYDTCCLVSRYQLSKGADEPADGCSRLTKNISTPLPDHRKLKYEFSLCNKNQQNTHFLHYSFNLIIVSSTRFEHPSVHPQEDLYMKFYGILFMHPYKQSGRWQDVDKYSWGWILGRSKHVEDTIIKLKC